MVQAWLMDNDSVTDRRQPHQGNPPRFLSTEALAEYGVSYWKIESEEQLNDILKEGGYTYQDQVTCSKECLENFEEMMEKFYEEHLHTEPETRLIAEGAGYFDFRKADTDEWVRVSLCAGEMISLPAGLYHRFSPDTSNYTKARRFFQGSPVWTAYNRADAVHTAHHDYIKTYQAGVLNKG